MATNTEQRKIEILVNGNKANASVKDMEARVAILTNQWKKMQRGTEEYVKKTEELKKSKDQLSEVRQELKQTDEATQSLTDSLLDLIPFGGKIKELGGGFGDMKGQVNGVSGSFKGLGGAIAASGIGLLLIVITGLVTWFQKSETGAKKLSAIMAGFGAITDSLLGILNRLFTEPQESLKSFGDSIKSFVLDRIKLVMEGVKGLGSAMKHLWNLEFSEAAEAAGKAFVDINRGMNPLVIGVEAVGEAAVSMAKDVKDAFKEGFELEEAKQQLKLFQRESELVISGLQSLYDIQSAIADDATRSFKEREEASSQAMATLEKQSAREKALAAERLAVAQKEFEMHKRNDTLNDEIRDNFVEAQMAMQEAENNYTLTLIDNEKQRRELKQDRLERDLDILIDGFDNVKMINEKIITNDKVAFDERVKRLEKLKELSDSSLEEQVKTIEQFTNKQVDMNDLLATSDAKQLNEKIRNLELSEIIEGRLLEIIRERRMAVSDFAELEQQLNDEKEANEIARQESRMERIQADMELEAEILEENFQNKLLTEEERDMALLELQQETARKKLKLLKDQGKGETLEAKKLSNEILKIESSKHKKIQEEEQRTAEFRREMQREVQATLQGGLNFLIDLFSQDEEARKKNADKIKMVQRGQVVVDGIKEVAGIWAGYSSMGPVGIALAAIQSGIAVGRTLLAIKNIDKQKYAVGGYTGNGLYVGSQGLVDSTGQRIAGVVHQDEWVAPAWMVQSPMFADTISYLEAARQIGGYQDGGITSVSSSLSQATPDLPGINAMNDKLDQIIQLLGDWPTLLKVYNVLTETEDGLKTLNSLRDRSSIN